MNDKTIFLLLLTSPFWIAYGFVFFVLFLELPILFYSYLGVHLYFNQELNVIPIFFIVIFYMPIIMLFSFIITKFEKTKTSVKG